MPKRIQGVEKNAVEWSYVSGKKYEDPFNAVELDVLVKHPDGGSWRAPAYWAGEQEWRVRFAPPMQGCYEVETVCSDEANKDLHAQSCTLDVSPYGGQNRFLKHGPIRVAASRRTFEHADGTPFFWFGDTWWMGLCKRLSWPDDFQLLAADRVAKGFSVIQIIAGLYPDMPPFDERGANEAGFPWEADYERINPAYFDMADLRVQWLARSGLVPCIVGCWGYFLPWMGVERMKKHWRNIIARWGAYPVVWCLAGEAQMPYYLSKDKEGDAKKQKAGWTELARYVRQTDSCHRVITIHPTQVGRDQVEDEGVLDLDMLQTGHGGFDAASNTVGKVLAECGRKPAMPVLVGEVTYEGILHGTHAEVQRLMFWASVLSGAAGHTYGANGLWQVNTREKAYGPSPHGGNYGDTPWEDAYRLPGSTHLGLAKSLLERYEWWRFGPHQEWVEPNGSPEDVNAPFAAGIPGRVRVIYFYNPFLAWSLSEKPRCVTQLEPQARYTAFFWDPTNGKEYPLGAVEPDADGRWLIPDQPALRDWVLVLEAGRP